MAECTAAERMWLDALKRPDCQGAFRARVLVAAEDTVAQLGPQKIERAKDLESQIAALRKQSDAIFSEFMELRAGELGITVWELLVLGKEPRS